MSIEPDERNRFVYRHRRLDSFQEFEATYGPVGDVQEAKPGTLEHFLTERYCLYSVRPDGALLRVDVHHLPWPLQRADATIQTNTMTASLNITLSDPPPLLHFADRVDVVVWSPQRVG